VNPSQPTMPAKPVQAGQAADRTNRVSPQGAEAERNSVTPTPKAANNQLAKREAKKNNLPQTGEQHTSAGIIGLLAMVLGFFGLTDHKKKKDE
ncbi:MAG: LPXTG cell wall anchor domain-containing protein, partial [Lactobacillus sp.]